MTLSILCTSPSFDFSWPRFTKSRSPFIAMAECRPACTEYVDAPPDRIRALLMVIVLQCKRSQAFPHQGNASVTRDEQNFLAVGWWGESVFHLSHNCHSNLV
jgi:hypothetical protein